MTVSMLAGPSRWGQAPGRSAAHGRCLAGPVDPVRIPPPLALDPGTWWSIATIVSIFAVSNFVILDALPDDPGPAGSSQCMLRGRPLLAAGRVSVSWL
eukprot:COSAG03_NODE_634_length_6605_cov_829.694743_4_plen_98_part_00